jgi:hypothetical protein
MCALVVNLAKRFVASNASAIRKADKYSMHWARATMTCFGKSVTSAINFPVTFQHPKRTSGARYRPDVKLVDAFPQWVFWV